MRPSFATGVSLLALIAGVGCGPERKFTGVWRLESCAKDGPPEGTSPCPDDPFMYELHLGRYGGEVTGLLVRYRYAFADLTFGPTDDCGCNFVVSGRADDDSVHFQIHEPTVPGCRDESEPRDAACDERSPAVDCGVVRFDLEGDEDVLEGTLSCAAAEATEEYKVRFRRESGRPRTLCRPCADP